MKLEKQERSALLPSAYPPNEVNTIHQIILGPYANAHNKIRGKKEDNKRSVPLTSLENNLDICNEPTFGTTTAKEVIVVVTQCSRSQRKKSRSGKY